ncbi:MAG: hypothetical protein AAGK21_14295 [Bacteroidota bacterium]
MDQTVVFRADRRKTARAALQSGGIALAFAAAIVYVSWSSSAAAFGLAVAVAFLAFGARKPVRFLSQLVNDRVIILDERGITDRSYGLGFIPWSNVEGAELKTLLTKVPPVSVVELDLVDPEAYLSSAKGLDGRLIRRGYESGSAGFWLNTFQLEATPEEVFRMVLLFIDKYSPDRCAG